MEVEDPRPLLRERRKRRARGSLRPSFDSCKVVSKSVVTRHDKNVGYRRDLEHVLRTVFTERQDYAELFEDCEKQVIHNILEQCSQDELTLLSRMLRRKGPWFRVDQLTQYCSEAIESESISHTAGNIIDCEKTLGILKQMNSHNLVNVIIPGQVNKVTNDQALCAVETALSNQHVQAILKHMRIGARGSKTEGLSLLRKTAKSQTTLFGSGLPIANSILKAVPSGVVAVADNVKNLIRRAYSLYYLTSSDSSFQLAKDTDGKTDEEVDGPFFSPGLLAWFGILQFETYSCQVTSRVFSSRKEFELFEIAQAIRARCESLAAENRWRVPTGSIAEEQEVVVVIDPDEEIFTLPSLLDYKTQRDCVDQLEALDVVKLTQCLRSFLDEISKWPRPSTKPFVLNHYDVGMVLSQALTFAVQGLEKVGAHQSAIECWQALLAQFPHSRQRGFWWNRLSVDRKHLGRIAEACEACIGCLLDEAVSGMSSYRVEAKNRLNKLLKRKATPAIPHAAQVLDAMSKDIPSESDVPVEHMFGKKCKKSSSSSSSSSAPGARCEYTTRHDTPEMVCFVEQYVLEYYEMEEGWSGHHCEGSIFRSLFALFMWDAIFNSSVPDVFQTGFQDAPLDLCHSYGLFYNNRREQVDCILGRVKSSSPSDLALWVRQSWRDHFGIQVCGHRWDQLPRSSLECIVACIGPILLESILRRMVLDYRHCSGGGPDLLLYRIQDAQGNFIRPVSIESLSEAVRDLNERKESSTHKRRRHRAQTIKTRDEQDVQELDFDDTWQYRVKFIEVKSKNDRLSDKQVAWIAHLNKASPGVASVCKVTDDTDDLES